MVSGGSFGHNEVHLHLRGEEELQDFSFYFSYTRVISDLCSPYENQ